MGCKKQNHSSLGRRQLQRSKSLPRLWALLLLPEAQLTGCWHGPPWLCVWRLHPLPVPRSHPPAHTHSDRLPSPLSFLFCLPGSPVELTRQWRHRVHQLVFGLLGDTKSDRDWKAEHPGAADGKGGSPLTLSPSQRELRRKRQPSCPTPHSSHSRNPRENRPSTQGFPQRQEIRRKSSSLACLKAEWYLSSSTLYCPMEWRGRG